MTQLSSAFPGTSQMARFIGCAAKSAGQVDKDVTLCSFFLRIHCSVVAIVAKSTTKIFLQRLLQQKGCKAQRLRGMIHLATSVARD